MASTVESDKKSTPNGKAGPLRSCEKKKKKLKEIRKLPGQRLDVFSGRKKSGAASARKESAKKEAAKKKAGKKDAEEAKVEVAAMSPIEMKAYRVTRAPAKDQPKTLAWHWYLIGGMSIAVVILLIVLQMVRLPAASTLSADVSGAAGASGAVSASGGAVVDGLSIVIFNGWTIADIDDALDTRKLAQDGAFEKAVQEVVAAYGLPFAEGMFLAGTYTVPRGSDLPVSLAKQMAEAFMQCAKPWFAAVSESGRPLCDYAVIASMISAETKNPEEYQGISSVIHNRLVADMPLGIDATTRYELQDWTSALTPDVFETLSRYNTRRVKGLPPTGICCPNSETLHAAIFPEDTEYLYYRHDQNSLIHFSVTYDQHLQSQKDNP